MLDLASLFANYISLSRIEWNIIPEHWKQHSYAGLKIKFSLTQDLLYFSMFVSQQFVIGAEERLSKERINTLNDP